jgi:DNA polymerase-3 subunit gamma/tau
MVNCEKGPTAEPCGTCEQCLRIRDGSHLDVVEIDAASHGGVDDARELRERAPTAPAMGREKVYIIDEAQRLSREAFDALLKVFEEPPPGVRFVLATTEPHKMPATIVGRCQRFDFRRLGTDTLAQHLVRVAADEGVKLTDQAAEIMSRQAEGSARDALSLLDQASVLGGTEIGEDVVQQLLGAPRSEIQTALADAVAVGDTAAAFELVDRMVQEGQDVRHATSEALQHFRNLLLANTAPGQADLIDAPPDEYERLRGQAAKFQPAELSRVIGLLLAAQTDMRWTTSPRLTFELALARATMPEADPAPEGLVARIERLERLAHVGEEAEPTPAQEPSPAAPAPKPAASKQAAKPAARKEPEAAPAAPSPEPREAAPDAGSVDVAMLRRSWPALIDHLGQLRQPILRAILESATVATFDGQTIELAFPPDKKFGVQKVADRQDDLQQAIEDIFGIRPAITCVVRESRDPLGGVATVEIVEEDEVPDEAEALRRVQEMFGAQPVDGAGE